MVFEPKAEIFIGTPIFEEKTAFLAVSTVNSLISVGGCGELQGMVSVYPKVSACRDWCWR